MAPAKNGLLCTWLVESGCEPKTKDEDIVWAGESLAELSEAHRLLVNVENADKRPDVSLWSENADSSSLMGSSVFRNV